MQLKKLGVPFEYETLTVKFVRPAKATRYTPDFKLPNGIIIEAKGIFFTKDRQKHLMIKELTSITIYYVTLLEILPNLIIDSIRD